MGNNTNPPRHVAIIMDGNGRWAEQRGLTRLEGHREGVKNIRPVIKHLVKQGVTHLTLYAFSTENWNRPQDEVSGIFSLLESVFSKEVRAMHKNDVKILHIGRMEGITPKLQKSIGRAIKLTANNKSITVTFAFNYGGRAEIVDAVRKFVSSGEPVENLNEKTFGNYLYTAGLPEVDLVIRTSGEQRTSNFLIWQTAYSELYFTPVFWPDFGEKELDEALTSFSRRQRRFGGLSAEASCSEKES